MHHLACVQRKEGGTSHGVIVDPGCPAALLSVGVTEWEGERVDRCLAGCGTNLLVHPLKATSEGIARCAFGCEVVLHGIPKSLFQLSIAGVVTARPLAHPIDIPFTCDFLRAGVSGGFRPAHVSKQRATAAS